MPQPAAGAEWSWGAPSDSLCRVTAVTFRLAAAAGGTARQVYVSYYDPTTRQIASAAAGVTAVPAGDTVTVFMSMGANASSLGNTGVTGALPWLTLPPHCVVKGRTRFLAGGDQYSDVVLLVELY